MMKHLAILFTVLVLVQSQRPPYAGSNKPYPSVLPQYLEEQAAAAAAAAGNSSENGTSIVNRIDTGNVQTLSATIPTTTTINPLDLPVDALGDINLINKIKKWPRDKQPFWFINWQQIQEHRGDTRYKTQANQTELRSSFVG